MGQHRLLILLRHAKSSWDDASLPDDERPLAPRGRRALHAVEHHMRVTQMRVDLVLCSPARRARETWDGVRFGVADPAPEIRYIDEIYEASADQLRELLRCVDDKHLSVLVVGHNPGLQELADGLVTRGTKKALTRLGEGFPTAAMAIISFDCRWSELAPGAARLESFVRPRELLAQDAAERPTNDVCE